MNNQPLSSQEAIESFKKIIKNRNSTVYFFMYKPFVTFSYNLRISEEVWFSLEQDGVYFSSKFPFIFTKFCLILNNNTKYELTNKEYDELYELFLIEEKKHKEYREEERRERNENLVRTLTNKL